MTMTTTPEAVKHLHGTKVHEHPGGGVPHDHPRKLLRLWLKIAAAVAGVLVLIVLLAWSHPGAAAPAPRPTTTQQVAESLIGTGVQNGMTGQDLHETVEAAVPHGSFTPVAAGGKQFRCTLTLSNGETLNVVVTLWSDGSTGWRQAGP